ncbi:hypothetical protein D3C87_2047190 [compost metagenome]
MKKMAIAEISRTVRLKEAPNTNRQARYTEESRDKPFPCGGSWKVNTIRDTAAPDRASAHIQAGKL